MDGHKKHKKKHKKEKRKKKRSSSTSESSSEEDLWVEKGSNSKKSHSPAQPPLQREDWLSKSDDLFATITSKDLKPRKEKKPDPDRPNIDEMGQSSRELNPYWKDGGTGLPEESSSAVSKQPSGTVGDLGLGWLRRALERSKQTALEENKPLEEVVAPVWGSLDKLLSLIKEAEDKMNCKSKRTYDDSYHYRTGKSHYSSRVRDSEGFRKYRSDERDVLKSSSRDDRESSKSFRKPSDSDYPESSVSNKPDISKGFRKSSYSNNYDDSARKRYDSESKVSSKQSYHFNERLERLRNNARDVPRSGWKKAASESTPHQSCADRSRNIESLPSSSSDFKEETNSARNPEPDIPNLEKPEILTHDEMNKLAAEILKAEMFGNESQVKGLKEKLKKAQSWLLGSSKSQRNEPKEVILTQTDRRGFTQPISSTSSSQPQSKRRSKFETHKDGKRARYFKDDDHYSLQDLVHQEKLLSVSDQNEMYAKLAKGVGQKSDDDDYEEGGGREKSDEWAEFSKRQRAVLDSTKREKKLDSCRYCLDSHAVNRRLVISLMDKVYLSVPPYQSLTDGHCLIMPIQHTPSATLLDEDVWDEVMDLRKLVVKMFLEEDKDVIFYESAKHLDKFPHMVLNCIPVPKDVGDDAPIYFKKALLECETEWSNNKKVVDLKGRDIRKAVPKGLSYFAVDFGLQSGYAHVIEDERLFPKNFAEEVIGGMMDMDHAIWRKQRIDNQEVQIAKTQEFIKKFKDFTSKAQF